MADSWARVLVLRFSSIGDIIQTTSVLNTIKKYFPDTEIEYLTLKKYESLLFDHPSIDFLHSIDPGTKIGSIKNLINSKPYDALIDLHNSVRSKLIRKKVPFLKSYFVAKPRKNRFLLFLNHKNKFSTNFNQRRWLHEPLINVLPPDHELSQISLYVSEKEKSDGIQLLNKNGLNIKKYFTMIPGSAWRQKQWSAEKYIELANICEERYKMAPVILGSEKDIICKEIFKGLSKNAIDLSGKSNLRQSMSIISNSSLSIGSDTGFIYASEALDIPTIVILGPTSFETGAGVYSKKSLNIFKNDIWCRPCSQNGSFPCYRKAQFCMEDINTNEILINIEKLLA